MNASSPAGLTLSVADALKLAIRLHQDGRLDEAEHVYQEVLKGDPANVDALHYLGVAMIQLGQPEDGEVLIRKALVLAPEDPATHNHLGEALRVQGRFAEAEKAYEGALKVDPEYVEAINNRAVAYSQQGRLDDAIAQFDLAISISPDYAEAYNNKGVVLEQIGELDQAILCFADAVRKKGNYPDAQASFEQLLKKLGTSSTWVQRLKGEMEDGVADYERLVEEYPDVPEAHNMLGVILCERLRFDEGLEHYRKAVMLKPNFVEAINNIGVALHELNRPSEAIPYYHRALELNPGDPQIHCNLGAAYQETLNLQGSEQELREALAGKPDYPEAHYNLSLLELTTGRFAQGWRDYIHRSSLKDKSAAFALAEKPLPMDLNGKRILIRRNQGLGDELFFLRFAEELKRRGAWICYAASPKLAPVVSRLSCLDQVIIKDVDAAPINLDYAFSVAELPLALGMSSWDDIPPSISLPVEPTVLERTRSRLAKLGAGPFVGVTWRAGTPRQVKHANQRLPLKTLPLEAFAKAVSGASGQILILQRNPEPGEIERFSQALGRPVHDFCSLNENLDEMLALVSLLDDYIGVSNTNTHLRAAVGKVGHTLVPTTTLDWRWLAQGDESPWYPGFRIHRQSGNGSWDGALAGLANDLK